MLLGLCRNHCILGVVLGLAYNVALGGLRGAALPFFLENLAKLVGQAFGPIVLFMAGAANVGAFSQLAYDHLRWLKARSKQRDRTEYTGWAADKHTKGRPFMEHWTRRIATAVVRGNARRALNALASLAFRLS